MKLPPESPEKLSGEELERSQSFFALLNLPLRIADFSQWNLRTLPSDEYGQLLNELRTNRKMTEILHSRALSCGVREGADREDLIQAVFTKLLRQSLRYFTPTSLLFRPDSPFMEALKELQTKRKRQAHSLQDLGIDLPEDEEEFGTVLSGLLVRKVWARVKEIVKNERQIEVLELTFQGSEDADIAVLMRVKEAKVRALRFQAREKLARHAHEFKKEFEDA